MCDHDMLENVQNMQKMQNVQNMQTMQKYAKYSKYAKYFCLAPGVVAKLGISVHGQDIGQLCFLLQIRRTWLLHVRYNRCKINLFDQQDIR